jgi:hypothetical protein
MKTRVFAVCVVVFLFCGITHAGLSDGLVAYYPFNGNANDESGNGNNGTVNGATLTMDRFGNPNSAYNFDGMNNFIEISSLSNMQYKPITYSVWINVSSYMTDVTTWQGRIIIGRDKSTSGQEGCLQIFTEVAHDHDNELA